MLSIHPRHWSKTGHGKKVSTSKKPEKETLNAVIKGISHHLEKHPADAASRAHLKKVQEKL